MYICGAENIRSGFQHKCGGKTQGKQGSYKASTGSFGWSSCKLLATFRTYKSQLTVSQSCRLEWRQTKTSWVLPLISLKIFFWVQFVYAIYAISLYNFHAQISPLIPMHELHTTFTCIIWMHNFHAQNMYISELHTWHSCMLCIGL